MKCGGLVRKDKVWKERKKECAYSGEGRKGKMEGLEDLVAVLREGVQQIGEVARQLEGLKIEVRGVREELRRGQDGREKGRRASEEDETKDGTRTTRETVEEGEEKGAIGRGARKPGEKEGEEGGNRKTEEENGKKKKEEDVRKDGNGTKNRGEKEEEEEEGRREGEKRWEKVQGKGARDEEGKDRKRRKWEEELRERGKRKNNVMLRGKMEADKMGIGRTEEILGLALGKDVRIRRIVERMKRGEEGTLVLEMDDEEGKAEMLEGRKKLEEEGLEVKEDLTWWERKTRFKLAERASEERARGRRVWMDSRTLKVNGVVWKWDELEEEWQEG